jgi:hypothetical protein
MKTKEEIEQETFEDYLIKNPYQDTRSFTQIANINFNKQD